MRPSLSCLPLALACSCNQTSDIEFNRARAIDFAHGGLSGSGGAIAAGGGNSGGSAVGAVALAWSSVPSPGDSIYGLWGSGADDV